MITATKIFEFEAAHSIPNHPGKCKNLHGHSYKLEVEVGYGKGDALNDKGMVIDFGDLKKIVEEYVDKSLDHKYLNESFIEIPTAEKMVHMIAFDIGKKLPLPAYVVRVRLWETSTCYAEWRID